MALAKGEDHLRLPCTFEEGAMVCEVGTDAIVVNEEVVLIVANAV
jgi:hypothetical protein